MTRKLPAVKERVETGNLKFGDDWTGLFIRGDDAFAYALFLEKVLEDKADVLDKIQLKSLLVLLRGTLEK
jgi:hypothetical protein